MDVFSIPLLAILALFHQTSTYEESSVRGRTIVAAPGGESDTTEVIGVLSGSVTFCINNTDGNPALWSFGENPIVTVQFKGPLQVEFHKKEYKTRFAVSEDGLALTISQLSMEDAGTYSVKISGKTSTFTLQVFRELAEPTVTWEAQNCSDGSCHLYLRCSVPGTGFGNISYTWRVGDQLLAEGPVLLVNELLLDTGEPLKCTAENPVSSRSVTVTIPRVFCTAITTHPPSPDAHSGNWILPVTVGVVVVVVFGLTFLCRKFKAMKGRCRGSVGSQGDSHGAAEEQVINMDTQAQSLMESLEEINPLVLCNTTKTVDKALKTNELTNTTSLPDEEKDQVKTREENNMGH